MSILQEEAELEEIVQSRWSWTRSVPADRMTLETARMIREDFLQQNAFITEIDAYSSYGKQYRLLDLDAGSMTRSAAPRSARAPSINGLFNIGTREAIGRAKYGAAGRI